MTTKYSFTRKMMLAGALAGPLFFFPAPAAKATVTITPTIVVIEGRERFADVNLVNVTDTTNSYAIDWMFNEMVEGQGTYKKVYKSTTDFDLTKNVFFSPRRVTIQPKAMQKIRLALRLKGEPPAAGDYRAHLEMKQTSDTGGANTKLSAPDGQKKMSVGVSVKVGFSIPVIYRVGESDVMPVIGSVTTTIEPKSGKIQAVIPVTRTDGPYGVMGQLKVFYNDKEVGLLRNANIFREVKSRTFHIPLNIPALSGGKLKIVYKHYDTGNEQIYAEKTVSIAQ